MKLLSYIGQMNQNYPDKSGTEAVSAQDPTAQGTPSANGLRNGLDAIRGKLPGQTVSGEILLKEGNEILLSIGKNQLLQARLDGSISAQPGQILAFQIKNNSGSKVVLSPLFENLGQDPSVSKALQAANLPENSITARMVRAMMQEGLPIDRQSLYQMNRLINANPQADIQTLVQMQRLSLPVTQENIFQFEAYKSYQHQLGSCLTDIVDTFSQSFAEMTGSSGLQEGLSFYRDVLGILLNTEAENSAGTEQSENSPGAEIEEGMKGSVLSGKITELPPEEQQELVRHLRAAGVPDKVINAAVANRAGARELLGEIEKLLSDEALPDQKAVSALLDSRAFKHLLKNQMKGQWFLDPAQVAEEGSVERLYERLNSQMNRLSQVLSQAGGENTPLAKAAANVSNNIDFMNQLNQMFTYVQIPLKMQSKNANGELFVYTNKRSLARKEGSVSALLHLDMEHLGSVDVHVALNNQKVSTKFYLKDDSALDLIAQNIGILNKRLEDRGYTMNAEFMHREEETNMLEEVLKQGKTISALAGYSFDARA